MPMSAYTEPFVADEHLLALVRQVVALVEQKFNGEKKGDNT
jgi:hypothetical protein